MEPKQIDVFGLFQDLYTKGVAKFSDHVINESTNKNGNNDGNARKD